MQHDPEYRPLRGPLYHYTSLDALLSILQRRSLWATNVAYLNDASEVRYGCNLMSEMVVERAKSASVPEREFLDHLRAFLQLDVAHQLPIYVLCFSEQRDQLSQWRGYTPHGRGVSVGFNSGALIRRMQKLGWQWQACYYGRPGQSAYAQAIVTRLCRVAEQGRGNEDKQTFFDRVIHENVHDLLQVAAMIKNPVFAEEKEWRLMSPVVGYDDKAVQYRAGRSTLLPYVEFPLAADDSEPIHVSEVILGPTPAGSLSEWAALKMIMSKNVKLDIGVSSSSIPFRQL